MRLSFVEAGAESRSPVIVLVPGWTMPGWIWQAQLERLCARFRVAVLDPRGQGDSELAPSGYHIDRRADDIGEFIARYERVVLAGWSLAALEALHCTVRHGERHVAGLMLVDSSVGQDPAPPESSAFREALRAHRGRTMEEFVRGMFATHRSDSEIARLRQAAMRLPVEQALALFPSHLPREHWRDACARFRGPLWYVVTPRLAGQAANLQAMRPQTRVEIFEDAGHALFVDQARRFNALLAEFAAAKR